MSEATTDRLIDLIRQRHDAGLAKYGTTVDRKDLTPEQWAQHAIEEMLDGAAYLMRLKDEIGKANPQNADLAARRGHRIGRFEIEGKAFSEWELYLPIFAKCFVVRCEYMVATETFEVEAFSPLFEVVKEGTIPPRYEVIILESGGAQQVIARKIKR